MKKIASMNKGEVLETLNKLANLQNQLLVKLAEDSGLMNEARNELRKKMDKYLSDGIDLAFYKKPYDIRVPRKIKLSFDKIGKFISGSYIDCKFNKPTDVEACINDLIKCKSQIHSLLDDLSENLKKQKAETILNNEKTYLIPLK